MADAQAVAVDDLLAAYRTARLQAFGVPTRAEVVNDIRRSAAAARDALRADGSPHAARLDEFIDATEREDSLQRVKHLASTGMELTNAVGQVAGVGSLAGLSWVAVAAAGLVGLVVGFLLVVNFAVAVGAAAVAAVPIGFLLSRGSMVAGNAWKSYERYMATPDRGRQIINTIVVPAEKRFFAVVPGSRILVRTTTTSAATQKALVTVAGLSLGVGLLIGVIVGAGQS